MKAPKRCKLCRANAEVLEGQHYGHVVGYNTRCTNKLCPNHGGIRRMTKKDSIRDWNAQQKRQPWRGR